MLTKLKQAIDKGKNSNSIIWRKIALLKDFIWCNFYSLENILLLPYYFLKHFGYIILSLKINTQRKKSAINKLICFEISERYFFDNYKPIFEILKKSYEIYFICQDKELDSFQKYLQEQGVEKEKILPGISAFFINWDVYLNCWLSKCYPSIAQKKNVKKIQIYHGVGVSIMDKHPKSPINEGIRKHLKRFDFHFIIGPQFEDVIQSIVSKDRIYKVGYPKLDKLFNQNNVDNSVLKEVEFPNKKKIVLYAPHHSPFLGFNNHGFEIIKEILKTDANLLIKPHNAIMKDQMIKDQLISLEKAEPRVHIAKKEDSTLYYPLADVIVTDVATSASAEAALCLKPIILINSEKWFNQYNKNAFEKNLNSIFPIINHPSETKKSLEYCLSGKIDVERNKKIVSQYYYNPGSATQEAILIIKSLL